MKTILVVDDQPDIADCVAMVLETYGYKVCTAYGAAQAIACAAEHRPDAVMLDLGMPVVSGYEVARRLRVLHGPRLRLIAHSAWDDAQTKLRITAAGFDAHLKKPASVAELISASA